MRFSIHSGPPADAQTYKKLKFVMSVIDHDGAPMLILKAWRGKARKPFAHYSFKTTQARDTYLAKLKQAEDSAEVAAVTRKTDRQARIEKMAAQIKVGTILHYSWGYDQTNAEFYQVVDRFGARGVVIREIGGKSVPGSEGFMCDRVRPKKDDFIGEPIRKMIGPWGVSFDFGSGTPIEEGEAVSRSWYA
jgi:hypothetical protein